MGSLISRIRNGTAAAAILASMLLGAGQAMAEAGQPASLAGTVVTVDGRPAGGVTVTAVDAIDFRRSAQTDTEGRFAFLGLPAVNEIHSFEMLLGNEAFSDALDPTIAIDGPAPDDLGDRFAFRGVAGIPDLLEEELALLRGRVLPGLPADWLNETVYYPTIAGPDNAERRRTTNRRSKRAIRRKNVRQMRWVSAPVPRLRGRATRPSPDRAAPWAPPSCRPRSR